MPDVRTFRRHSVDVPGTSPIGWADLSENIKDVLNKTSKYMSYKC